MLLLLSCLCGIVVYRYAPPPALPENSPLDVFSAERAYRILKRILAGEEPHPVGSEANRAVRLRLMDEIKKLGFEPVEQVATLGNREVHNVYFKIPGLRADGVILLVSHYDSVPYGPGASDAMVCVSALLEVARILKEDAPLLNPVMVLLTDGEESRMLGSRAFCRNYEHLYETAAVINFDARGTSGPSLMFQTGKRNAWLVRYMAKAMERPVTSSGFVSVYEEMPNYTDFNTFKVLGFPGLDFAILGDAHRYHTSEDTVANVNLGSLQHHGENALGMARALSKADLAEIPKGDSVFFDVLAAFIISWPEPWSYPMALVAMAYLLITGIYLVRCRELTVGSVLVGLLRPILFVLVAALIGLGLTAIFRWSGLLTATFQRNDKLLFMLYLLATVLILWIFNALFARRGAFWPSWFGTWFLWSFLALVLVRTFVGLSYLFLVPVFFAVIAGAVLAFGGRRLREAAGSWSMVPACLVAGILWFPTVMLLFDAIGPKLGILHCGAQALALTAILPLVPYRRSRAVS